MLFRSGEGAEAALAGQQPHLLGMVVAAVVGYFSIQLVRLLASKGRFGAFAYYCWGAGALFILLNIMDWTFVPAA